MSTCWVDGMRLSFCPPLVNSGVRCMMYYSTISTRVLFLLPRSLSFTTLARLRSTLDDRWTGVSTRASLTFYRKSTLQLIGKNKMRRKIRLTESNAKCRHLKKLTSKALCGRCYQNPIPLSLPIHPYTLYTVYLFTQERGGGGVLNRKKGKGATVHKAGSTIATFLTESPVYKNLINTRRRSIF